MLELPTCHLPRWINPDTLECEHPSHDGVSDEPKGSGDPFADLDVPFADH